jgi:hypothetical protein
MNAGIWHAENAALCIVARDVTEVTWSLLTVARPSNMRSKERGREGRQDMAALRYCCAIAFLEVSEFQQLPHGAITPQYLSLWMKLMWHLFFSPAARHSMSSAARSAMDSGGIGQCYIEIRSDNTGWSITSTAKPHPVWWAHWYRETSCSHCAWGQPLIRTIWAVCKGEQWCASAWRSHENY